MYTIQWMNPDELIALWTASMASGNFLLTKHDPASLATTYEDFRSVLTPQMSSSLKTFIASGQFEVTEYDNNNPRHTRPYFAIRPLISSFSVVGSGVPSGSNVPSDSLDRLVIVSGSRIGWHCYAEDSTRIGAQVAGGSLSFVSTQTPSSVTGSPASASVPVSCPPGGSAAPSAAPMTGGSTTATSAGSP